MTETLLHSNTWPFSDLHTDIPFGMFADAHVVGALSCSLTSVVAQSGSIWIALSVTGLDGNAFEVSSDTARFSPDTKLRFYNAVGKCYGWLLTGPVSVPDTVVQDVSYPLAAETCVPVEGYEPANTTGMTGAWTIEGTDGIVVSTRREDDHLVVSFDPDETWWTVEDPNAEERDENDGVWTINDLGGESIRIDCSSGLVFPELDSHGVLKRILFVPPVVLFSDKPDGSDNTHYVFDPDKDENGLWAGEWSGDGGSVEYDEDTRLFTVSITGRVARTMTINETVVNKVAGQDRLERLTIAWKGLDQNDPYRKIIRTSMEDESPYPYPLDDILTGKVNGQS